MPDGVICFDVIRRFLTEILARGGEGKQTSSCRRLMWINEGHKCQSRVDFILFFFERELMYWIRPFFFFFPLSLSVKGQDNANLWFSTNGSFCKGY